jgi:hypothetical protein
MFREYQSKASKEVISNLAVQSESHVEAGVALVEKISSITFHSIEKTLEKAPPLQRKELEKSFAGIRIEWDTMHL